MWQTGNNGLEKKTIKRKTLTFQSVDTYTGYQSVIIFYSLSLNEKQNRFKGNKWLFSIIYLGLNRLLAMR